MWLGSRTGNSIGGVVEVVARNVPSGLGSPVFDKLEAELAKACMSLPASKGFEVSKLYLIIPIEN
jgi:chorismate synthase